MSTAPRLQLSLSPPLSRQLARRLRTLRRLRVPPLLIGLAGALLLSGCATPESRLRAGLVNAGLPEPLARCMAEHMVDRLSLIQLRRLSDLPAAREARTTDDFLRHIRSLRDPRIWTVTSTSAALCASGLAG